MDADTIINLGDRMKRIVLGLGIVFFLAGAGIAMGQDAFDVSTRMVQVESRPGIRSRIIIYRPDRPLGTVLLFPDGNGLLDITHVFNSPYLGRTGDIPIDLMEDLLTQGVSIVLMDAPTDHRSILGLNGWHGPTIFRLSPEHARDIGAIVDYLKRQENLPVWLAGIRMGAFSAVTAAIHLQREVDGLVIADGITHCPAKRILLQLCPDGLMGMPLHEVTVPTLILAGARTLPEPLLASALSRSPGVRFLAFPTDGDRHIPIALAANPGVLPGVSDAHVSREIADEIQRDALTRSVLASAPPPAKLTPLEIYLVGCYY